MVEGYKHFEATKIKQKNKKKKENGKYIILPIKGYLHVPETSY